MKKTNLVQSTQLNLDNKENVSQQSVVRDSPIVSRKRVKPLSLFIPNNIDLEDLLKRFPIQVANAKDYIAFLLHQIHAVPAFRNNVDIEETNGFTILNSTILQDKVDNYAPLLDWCIKRGLIECDNHSILKKKSFGYKFTPKYSVELKEYSLKLNTLIKKILSRSKGHKQPPVLNPSNLYNFQPEELRGRNMGYKELAKERLSYLEKWIKSDLKIETVSAENYLRELLAKEEQDPDITYPLYNYIRRNLVIGALNNKDNRRFIVDDKAGRLHTNLTTLQSELKAFIRAADGRKIASADIKNSQPLLSLVFLDERLFYKNNMLGRIAMYNHRFRNEISPSGNNNFLIYSMLGNFIRANSGNNDVILYRGLVLNGRIYEYFGNILQSNNIATDLNEHELRKYSKRELFRAFFDRNQAINGRDSRALRLFKHHFPTVYEIFSMIKAGKHNTLACTLQNLEAEVVLHRACRILSDNDPQMLLLTIHDSIASTIENYDVIKSVLSKILEDTLDVTPQIKQEVWDKSLVTKTTFKVTPSLHSEIIEPSPVVSVYGYADENDLLKSSTFSLKAVATMVGIGHRTLLQGLRELNILVYTPNKQNIPEDSFSNEEYFVVVASKRGYINIQTTKATDRGISFIKDLVKHNPNIFTPKKLKVK